MAMCMVCGYYYVYCVYYVYLYCVHYVYLCVCVWVCGCARVREYVCARACSVCECDVLCVCTKIIQAKYRLCL